MKIILFVIIGALAILALFNNKLNVFKIIKKQFIVYKNDRTKKASIYDIFTFFITFSSSSISICLEHTPLGA